MALRIPPRRSPLPVTLVDALNHICNEMAPPAPLEASDTGDIAAIIARDNQIARSQGERDALASDVAGVLLEAIEDGRLKAGNVPAYEMEVWRSNIGIFDWPSGRFTLAGPEIPYSLRQYHTPLVDLQQAVALFEEQPDKASAPEPVAQAPLLEFVHSTMSADRLTEAAVRQRAVDHFSPKRFTEVQWREAFKDAPNKLGRGVKPTSKSDK